MTPKDINTRDYDSNLDMPGLQELPQEVESSDDNSNSDDADESTNDTDESTNDTASAASTTSNISTAGAPTIAPPDQVSSICDIFTWFVFHVFDLTVLLLFVLFCL